MKIAVVTGASSGLGRAFALELDRLEDGARPEEIWLVARREEKLSETAEALSTPARILSLDLCTEEGLSSYRALLEKERPEIQYLVNSAGMGRHGAFLSHELSEELKTVDLNCKVPLAMSYLSEPYLGEGSLVIQVASVSAFLPQPDFAVYSSSKAMLLSFSRALAREWKGRGIRVLCCCPNPMETEFLSLAGMEGGIQGIKKLGREEPGRVARLPLKRGRAGKDISLTNPCSYLVRFFARILPHPFILLLERWTGVYKV